MSQKVIITKDGFNALTETNPKNLRFSSDYGTLKYLVKANASISFNANTGAISAKGIYTHNLGYFPYTEVFVRVWIGSPSGNYEACPLFASGISVEYNAYYIIKANTIELYGQINGLSTSVWHFDFIMFLYNNDLKL